MSSPRTIRRGGASLTGRGAPTRRRTPEVRPHHVGPDLVSLGVVVQPIAQRNKLRPRLAVGAEELIPQLDEIEILARGDVFLDQQVRPLLPGGLRPAHRGGG